MSLFFLFVGRPRRVKRLFPVAGEADTILRGRFLFGERFLLGFIIPLAITEIPVFKACRPACFSRGVALRMMFFIMPPSPCPL